MNKRKKLLSWVLTIAMLFSLVTALSITANAEDSYDAVINVVDGTGTGSGWTFASGEIWINENGSYLISGGGIQTTNRVRVKTGVTAAVTLDNVNIAINLPFEVGGTANVTMILPDDSSNTFTSSAGHAGIRVQPSATLTITTEGQPLGNGMLTATGSADSSSHWATAGIGGSELEASGTIIINGGIIFANGGNGRPPGSWTGPGAAGIGGAQGRSCGDITINGGTVTAIGGNVNPEGAGIGGGSSDPLKFSGKITINGGTVRAYSGQSGASGTGIGFCETIAIANTADVKAYSSGNYPAIYGTTATSGHTAFLLNFMLDSAALADTEITITQKDDEEDTFELVLLTGYKNFAATVETSNNYTAALSDDSKKIVSLPDEDTDFPGICDSPSTALSSVNVKLKANPVCMIGATEYETLDAALAAAPANEATTILLLQNISFTNSIIADNKTLTIDLNGNELNISNVADHALQAINNGVLNIHDIDEDGGSLTVESSGEFKSCAYAASGGDINITGTLTASFPGGMSYQEIIALNANGAYSTIILNGSATGYYAGACAQNSATITVIGDVEGGYYGAYSAYGGLVDITGNVTAGTNGLTVEYGGLAEVDGDITGGTGVYINNIDGWNAPTADINGDIISTSYYAINASGDADIDVEGNVTGQVYMSGTSSSSSIEITGDIVFASDTAIAHESGTMVITGDVTSTNGWGVASNSNFTLNGNITAKHGVHSSAPSGDITINGNITSDDGFGVYIYNGATVTVNGTISGASPYIRLDYVDYTEGSGTVEGDYMKYSTYTNNNPAYVHTVYVLLPQPVCEVDGCETTLADGGFSEYTEIGDEIYYHISTPEQLAHINEHLDLNFIQTADIDLSEYNDGNWTPIGTETDPFSGSFDGGNYVIEGLNINGEDYQYAGLFGYADGATFKNLTVGGTVTNTYSGTSVINYSGDEYDGILSYAGGVVAYGVNLQIENCHNQADISAVADSNVFMYCYAGGIAGYLTASFDGVEVEQTISECSNEGDVTALATEPDSTVRHNASSYAGGIVGCYYSINGADGITLTISQCENSGMINSTTRILYTNSQGQSFAGGIVSDVIIEGDYDGTFVMADCSNDGIVSIESDAYRGAGKAGGLVGEMIVNKEYGDVTMTIESCRNSAEVTALINSTLSGYANAVCYLGGIAGYAYTSQDYDSILTFSDCVNSAATLTASSFGYADAHTIVGGIVGQANAYTYVSSESAVGLLIIKGSFNMAQITATAEQGNTETYMHNTRCNAGGIVGCTSDIATIMSCYNRGSVAASGNSNYYAGGIEGYVSEIGNISSCYSTGEITSSGNSAANTGGVTGYLYSGVLSDCYWLTGTAGATVGTDSVTAADTSCTEKTAAELQSIALITALNAAADAGATLYGISDMPTWEQAPNLATNDGYPILSWVETPEEHSTGGGGSSIIYYAITANAGNGGSIDPIGGITVQKGQSQTFTITPESGYVISDVVVDGVSVGAVSAYTFTSVSGNHTIEVFFEHPSNCFTDVDSSLWYRQGIDFVLINGLFKGTSETTFEPNVNMTRAMLVTVLWRLENEPDATLADLFSDITNGTWYTEAVAWAAANDIVQGYDANTFGPDDPITREQMAAILYRYASYKGYDVTAADDLSVFNDVGNTSDWALATMKWAVAEGLIKGVSGNELDPAGYATRAQVATILMRFVQNIVE